MRTSAFSTVFLAVITAAFLISVPTAVADPNLIAHWKFDEGSGSTAYDSAGSNNGTIYGATWTTGQINGALSFDGSDDYVSVSGFAVNTNRGTIVLWFKTSADYTANYGSQGYLISQGNQYHSYLTVEGDGMEPYGIVGETDSQDDYFVSTEDAAPVGAWNHIAVSFYNKTAKTYINGTLIETSSVSNSSLTLFRIGGRPLEFFNGIIDDVRIYNRALSAGEVEQLFLYGFIVGASNPNPIDGATGVDPNVVLSWSPGYLAASHDVYFGTDYNDVNDADTNSPVYIGNFDVNSCDPCGLELMTTYYWRVDEVNEPNLWKGDVWSFETAWSAIELSETQFEFYVLGDWSNPNDQILGISNSGAGTLNWQIGVDCNWLSAEPNSGSSTGEVDDVNLAVDISSLTNGIYICNLTITDPNASNNPQTVSITLYIGDSDGTLNVPSEYSTIQGAIDVALDGEVVVIAPDTYTGTGNRDIDFLGKAITVRSTNPNDPDIVAATIIDCNGSETDPHRGFYFHSGEDIDSILAGLTITNGYGGGISCISSSPTITNCIIKDNATGGIYCEDSDSVITGCTITGNSGGSGIYADGDYSTNYLTISHCAINDNSPFGFFLYWGCIPYISYCDISGNDYGGIYSEIEEGFTISHCTITGNGDPQYTNYGGGINAFARLTIENCTISGNRADERGGGIAAFCGGWVTVKNSIIWDNHADANSDIYLGIGGCKKSPSFTGNFSIFQSTWAGSGNLVVDPCFANPGYWNGDDWVEGDYHLKSSAGRWDPNSQSWVVDDVNSPGIDAGDPNSDWTAELWPHGKRINMGAYGGTSQASMSPSKIGNIANLNNDPYDIVDLNDLAIFVEKWLYEEVLLPEDLDRNGIVNFVDYAILTKYCLYPPPPTESTIEYEITPCNIGASTAGQLNRTRFTVTVEGAYIHFEDTMAANCCPEGGLWLEMTAVDNLITIYEREAGGACYCICGYPVTAKLRPFETGTYSLEVYEDWGGFIGSAIVEIE